MDAPIPGKKKEKNGRKDGENYREDLFVEIAGVGANFQVPNIIIFYDQSPRGQYTDFQGAFWRHFCGHFWLDIGDLVYHYAL